MTTLPRRRRRRKAIIADRVIAEVKRKERVFLREVSKLLSEAIGFPVRVSRVKLVEPMSPEMRRARRMTKAQARQQVAEAFEPHPVTNDPDWHDKVLEHVKTGLGIID